MRPASKIIAAAILFVWAVCIALLCALAITVAHRANAGTIRSNEESCQGLSRAASYAVQLRDSGMPWDVAELHLQESLKNAKGDPDSFVKDDDDVTLILFVFEKIFKSDANEVTIVKGVYQNCMHGFTRNSYEIYPRQET